jgi:hypothetical protein
MTWLFYVAIARSQLLHNLTFMFPFQDQNYAWPGCFMLPLQGHSCSQPNVYVSIPRPELRMTWLFYVALQGHSCAQPNVYVSIPRPELRMTWLFYVAIARSQLLHNLTFMFPFQDQNYA